MTSDDKNTKASPSSTIETAVKKDVAASKKAGQPKDKSTSDATPSKAENDEKAANSPSGYSRSRAKKPVSKAYKDNWNAIYAKKKKNR